MCYDVRHDIHIGASKDGIFTHGLRKAKRHVRDYIYRWHCLEFMDGFMQAVVLQHFHINMLLWHTSYAQSTSPH